MQSCATFSNFVWGDHSVASYSHKSCPASLGGQSRPSVRVSVGMFQNPRKNSDFDFKLPIPRAWFVFLSGRLRASSSFSSRGLFNFTTCFAISVWSFFFFFSSFNMLSTHGAFRSESSPSILGILLCSFDHLLPIFSLPPPTLSL